MSVVDRIRAMWWLLSGHVTAEPTTSRIILSICEQQFWVKIENWSGWANHLNCVSVPCQSDQVWHPLCVQHKPQMKPVISSETFQKSLKVSFHEHPGDPSIESEPRPANVKIESWDMSEEELRADLQWSDLGKYLCNLLANGEMSDCSPGGPDNARAPRDLSVSDVLH